MQNVAYARNEEYMIFRFNTKKEYEDEIKRLISYRNDEYDVDEEYDNLVEEYLRFCTTKKDAE